VAGGIGLALLAHLLAIGAGVLGVVAEIRTSALDGGWVPITAGGQLVVFLGCMVFGILGLNRGDRGLGLGLLIGWAVGILILPVVGFGVCVAVLSTQGVGG
jgi:hypothetical protein